LEFGFIPQQSIENVSIKALSGSVGPRGQNRPADVALIQALLGLKRNRRGQAYLPGRVNGRFDT